MSLPCLFVERYRQGRGLGAALMEAAEDETRRQGRRGLTLTAHDWDFWFMPLSFFAARGYLEVQRRGREVLIWKPLDEAARPPRPLKPRRDFPVEPGRVRLDLFYNEFCPTSGIEAERVRRVAADYGSRLRLRQYPAEDRQVLERHQIPRAIFVDGREIGWGHEAPEDGIRGAIDEALAARGLKGSEP